MDSSPKLCESCGSQLPEGVKFCVQCGAPVPENQAEPQATPPAETIISQNPDVDMAQSPEAVMPQGEETPPAQPYTPAPPQTESPARPAYTPPPSSYPKYTPPAKSNNRLPCIIIGVVVVLGLICLGVLAVLAFLSFFPLNSSRSVVETEVVVETFPTQAGPVATQPSTNGGTGGPTTSANSIFDPFDDNSLGWEIDTASDLTTSVENGAYSVYTNETSTYFWIYPPVDFDPVVIEYDAWVDPATSSQDFGTYGVVCNLQDSQNFTYIEVDPNDGSFYLARFIDDEEISLRDPSWTDSSHFNIGAGEINHILVECYPDSISLSINNSFEDMVQLDPPASPGRSGLLIGTWDTLDPNGYKVFFDNFHGYVPQQ